MARTTALKAKQAKKGKETLVIVESPAKAKTIEKYLGSGYTVLASMGHLIDLPKSRLGIDVEGSFEPEYLTIRGKASLLKELEKAAKKADRVLLASDNDREGEAISYNLKNALTRKLGELDIGRIVFNEITPNAIREAVAHPEQLDESKVSAQKARRVLDRLVGYYLSPLLWKKVKNGLSAGRVQSVALRLICEREREVERFIPEEYWSIEADFKKGRHTFSALLVSLAGQNEARAVVESLRGKEARILDIKETEKSQRPKPPFTTSKLQQAAANRLGFTSKKTMQIAQQLYEGLPIGQNRIGLITYMRTDSVRVSNQALDEVRAWIQSKHPAELPPSANDYAVEKKAQDAHEAIRPTVVSYTPDSIKEWLSKDQYKLYAIIWERFVSSQMTPSKTRTTSLDIGVGDALFRLSATKVVEMGFLKVIKLLSSKEDKETILPDFAPGELIAISGFRPEQHFTQGPARYTDASIVKTLEERGIGRPSTYAPIISVLLERFYVTRDNKQLVPTQLGRIINDILVESFGDVIDVDFTARMEASLDGVEESKREWVDVVRGFFESFKPKVDHVVETLGSYKGSMDEPTDHVCEKCGKPMLKKLGRFGFFLACSGFPECRNTRSIPLGKCPVDGCGGEIVARRKLKGRGREFYGCSRYPECDFITHYKPLGIACPKCGKFLVEKYDKKRGPHKACINPACDYLHSADDEEAADD
jgi:DNA topoisomerase-1